MIPVVSPKSSRQNSPVRSPTIRSPTRFGNSNVNVNSNSPGKLVAQQHLQQSIEEVYHQAYVAGQNAAANAKDKNTTPIKDPAKEQY